MLAVAIHLCHVLVTVLQRVLEPGLDGTADPKVERQADDLCAGGVSTTGGVVGRGVIDHDHIETRGTLMERADHFGDRAGLVVRRNDG